MSITINGDSGISGVNGTAATPALQGEDSNTGIVFGTDTVQISTGGNTRATVNSSGTLSMGSSSFSNTCIELESDTTAATFSIQNHTGSGKLFSGFDSPGNETVTILAAGSVTATNTCKAWVNFTGTGTVAINDSFNVASITDNGTGDYTITFTNAMANANYAIVGLVKSEGPSNSRGAEGTQIDDATDPSTTAFRAQTLYGSSSSANGDTFDAPRVYFVVFGD